MSGLSLETKYFLWDVKGRLCSKFGEDRSKTELMHNLGRNRRVDGHRTDAKMILYSVQCCTVYVHCIGQTKSIGSLVMVL